MTDALFVSPRSNLLARYRTRPTRTSRERVLSTLGVSPDFYQQVVPTNASYQDAHGSEPSVRWKNLPSSSSVLNVLLAIGTSSSLRAGRLSPFRRSPARLSSDSWWSVHRRGRAFHVHTRAPHGPSGRLAHLAVALFWRRNPPSYRRLWAVPLRPIRTLKDLTETLRSFLMSQVSFPKSSNGLPTGRRGASS